MAEIVDNIEDFNRYYTGNWISCVEGEHIVPWYVIGCSLVEKTVQLTQDVVTTYRNRLAPKTWTGTFEQLLDMYSLAPPNLGAISTKTGLIYMQYSPKRQYYKGLHVDRILYKNFSYPEQIISLNKKLVESVFNKVYFEPRELIALLEKGVRIGGAISIKAGLYTTAGVKNICVSYGSTLVGFINNDTFTMVPPFVKYSKYFNNLMPFLKIV